MLRERSQIPYNAYDGAIPRHVQYGTARPRKRSWADQGDPRQDRQGRPGASFQADSAGLPGNSAADLDFHRYHTQSQAMFAPITASQPQEHHHHRLPTKPPPPKLRRIEQVDFADTPSPQQAHGPSSIVGQEGMPPPAPQPKGPKVKFTPADDQLLVDLKEQKNLTWKQIADFFPGRSSGTLQVRYCTKLKSKTMIWTDEMIERLKRALLDYENDKSVPYLDLKTRWRSLIRHCRWRVISSKVGNGFTPAACQEKGQELEVEARSRVLAEDAANMELEEVSTEREEIHEPSVVDFQ